MKSIVLSLVLAFAAGGAAAAQTAPCRGSAPEAGAEIHGPVLHVLDGRTLCVAQGMDPSQWVALQLSDAPSASTPGALMGVAFGKDVICTMQDAGRAVCRVSGQSIGPDLIRTDVVRTGTAWRTQDRAPSTPRAERVQVASAAS